MKTTGNPALSGSSWGWASNDLQAIINKASAGDVVFVAAGKYYGGFIMKEGVNVQGGYTANNSNPTERYEMTDADDSHYSILDGQGTQRVLTQLVPFSTATAWEGFVIQNGKPATAFKAGSIIYSQNGDNKIIGVLYQYDTETGTGKMIGTKDIRKQWGGYENAIDELTPLIDRTSAKANITGTENSAKIFNKLGQSSVDFSTADYSGNGNYAAYWCDTLTTGGYSDWYLPAPGELQKVYEANIQTILKSVGKDLKYPYWASGQVGNTLAWAYCFGNGYCHPALKYTTYAVSAVHAFTEPEAPNGIYFAGGGAFLYTNGILKNCIITNNVSLSKGGGVYCSGGQVVDCNVEGNNAPEGKEIYYETVSNISETIVQSFDVYPNPVQIGEKFNIGYPVADTFSFRIINTSGQTVDAGRINAEETLSAPLQKGVYILYLQSDKIHLSKKLIIK
ncbi:MAG: T9SS type A sorting domain-containing protein [Paludibacter sp.]